MYSVSKLCTLKMFCSMPPPPTYEMVVDAEDAAYGSFDQWVVFAHALDRQACADHMRVTSKIPDFTIPLEPRRKVFDMVIIQLFFYPHSL